MATKLGVGGRAEGTLFCEGLQEGILQLIRQKNLFGGHLLAGKGDLSSSCYITQKSRQSKGGSSDRKGLGWFPDQK